MRTTIQVIINDDRFHVSVNGVPISTHLFGNGISQEFAFMQANSQAYIQVQRMVIENRKFVILPTSKK